MKSFKFSTIAILVIAVLSLFTSCKKDKDVDAGPNIVGTWAVSEGEATVYQNGILLADINMSTFGTIEFNEDGTGHSNFGITMGGKTSEATGAFTWVEEGFELVITKQSSSIERWVRLDDERDLQRVQYTIEEEDDMEIELTLTFTRM